MHRSGQPAFRSLMAGRGAQLFLLAIAGMTGACSRTALGPIQEALRSALALSDNQLALLQGPALTLPVLLSSIPLGLVVDRYCRVRVLLLFAMLTAVGGIATVFASSFISLLVFRAVVGLTVSGAGIAVFSVLADLFPPEQRGRATVVVTVVQIVGASAAFSLGGAVLAATGPGPDSWRIAMGWLSVPAVPVAFLMLALREPPRTGIAIQRPSLSESATELWRYRSVVAPLLAGSLTMGTAEAATATWAAPTLNRVFGLAPDRTGAIVGSALLASGLLGPFIGGMLADLCQRTGGPRRTIMALSALALLNGAAGFFALMPSVTLASTFLIVFMTVGAVMGVMTNTLLSVVVPNELRGLGFAVSFVVAALFGGFAPVFVSLFSEALGGSIMIGRSLAILCVAAGVSGSAILATTSRSYSRHSAVGLSLGGEID